jgi:FkbM family methyltransferase
MRKKSVVDRGLGVLQFPAKDTVMSASIEHTGSWDQNMGDWLRSEVSPGDFCVNVGANVGYFTCLMSRLVGSEGHVVAIEPRSDLVVLLRENLKVAALKNVEVHQVAATSKSQRLTLFINPKNTGDNRMFDPRKTTGGGNHTAHGFAQRPKRRKVRGVPVDEILKGRFVDFCLIDTQGWDHEVIRGMKGSLTRKLPLMVVEFVPQWLEDLGEDPLDVLSEYESLGYRLSIFQDSGALGRSPKEILSWVREDPGYFCDVILRPI